MAEITDINKYKQSKELSNGRKPLYVSHLTGKVTGDGSFIDRLSKVKESIDNISKLIVELKQLQEDNK
jgi:hypothetical protein